MAARYPEWRKESPAKMAFKLVIVLGAFLLLIYCLLKVLVVNKEPLTADAVSNIVSSHGYTPQETTDIYHYKNRNLKEYLITVLLLKVMTFILSIVLIYTIIQNHKSC